MKIAKQDTHVVDGVGVRRLIKAGDPVPPGLVAGLEDPGDVIESDASDQVDAVVAATASYDAQSVEDLQAEADRRGLEVEGTGKDGNVLKADLVAALEASDE